MKLDENQKLLLSDTLVPDIFITEYLPALDGLAVKVYVYLLLALRKNRKVSENDLARRMGTDKENIKIALLALSDVKLVEINSEGMTICDVKAQEIERIYRPKTASTPLEMMAQSNVFSQREQLIRDISKTFFQGLMSPSWYAEIDSWFDRYHFEPEVVYALFQECSRRNKLDNRAYITKVAENWSARKIITYQDLNDYFVSYEKIKQITKKIGRKLRKSMTEYDEEIVSRWVEKMGYEFEIIEIALRKTVKISQPNLAYIDRILQEWFSHQLRDVTAINAYETDKAAKYGAAAGSKSRGPAGAGNIGNFAQRDYSEDFLNEFYEPLTKEDSKGADGK
ncbi:MAG: DnaD domain protein [Clostridiaceae bacterium]|nr:DnaD domain protein [Clostridiaceae bacterium]